MAARLRSIASALLGLVAILGLLTSVVALWAHDAIFDSGEIAAASEAALAEPAVTAALATRITDLAFEAAEVEQRMAEMMPWDLYVVPALVGGAHAAVSGRIEAILGEESTRAIVAAIVERGHAAIMEMFDGDGLAAGWSVSEGEVRLNLLPLVSTALENVQALGYLPGREVPSFTPEGNPADQIAELEAAFDRELPDDFGQFSVYRSNILSEAGRTVSASQHVLVLAKRALLAVLAITVLCFLGCGLLARRRRVAVLRLALASVAVMLVAMTVVRRVLVDAPTVAFEPAGRAAIRAALGSLTDDLLVALMLTALLGIAVAFAALLRSDQRSPLQVRRTVSSNGSGAPTATGRDREITGIAAFALAVAMIVFGGLSVGSIVLAGVFALIGVWATWTVGTSMAPVDTTPESIHRVDQDAGSGAALHTPTSSDDQNP